MGAGTGLGPGTDPDARQETGFKVFAWPEGFAAPHLKAQGSGRPVPDAAQVKATWGLLTHHGAERPCLYLYAPPQTTASQACRWLTAGVCNFCRRQAATGGGRRSVQVSEAPPGRPSRC
jgi:hypothetical protein